MKGLRLVVFAKAPVPGFVKTRLVPALGEVGAALLARRMLLYTVREAYRSGIGEVELCVTPEPENPVWATLREQLAARVTQWTNQGPGDLGHRLARAAERSAALGKAVLLLGTDCPALKRSVLRACGQVLARQDAVLVPSTDGGYVLLGARHFHPRLFSDIAWSTSSVAAQTRARLRELGWRWVEFPALTDIDEPAHLSKLPPSLARGVHLAP